MFVENNDRIDYKEVEKRLEQELARLPDARAESAPQTLAAVQDRGVADRQHSAPRSLRRTLSNLLWAVRHAPTVVRRAIAAVFTAEDMRVRVALLEQQSRLAEPTALELGRPLAELRSRTEAKFAVQEDRLRQFAEKLEMVKREIMFQQRRLTLAVLPAPDPSAPSGSPDPGRHDSLYAAFEDVFRGSRGDVKQRLATYVDRLALAGVGELARPILDIGCGRGEWLELLREHGLAAYGIDSNMIMVERSVALGLDVRQADLLTHLRSLGDASHSAITAFHVFEHLPFGMLVDVLDEALRVLAPGGLLLIETPNPETVRVGASTFYNDPTHRNPLMPEPLRFIVEHRGFTDAEILRLHPFEQGLLEEPTGDAKLLNRVLFGPQDYAILARRI